MKKIIILLSLLVIATAGATAHAQTSSSPTVEELQKQIQLLLSQVGSLQKEVTTLKSQPATPPSAPTTPTVSTVPTTTFPPAPTVIDESEINTTETAFVPPPQLTRSLFRGARGDDVRQLQEFLAQDPTIYPEGLATGYYGVGTETAVRKWQTKQGLPAVGVVGRQTIAKFKEIYSGTNTTLSPTTPTDTSIISTNRPTVVSKPTDTTLVPKPELDFKKGSACPALPTVDSCLAGEERVVTYKSDACGVYYACKTRTSTRTDNTVAVLKKVSAIQSDTRYTVNLNDPEGIQRFSVYNSKGAEIQTGYPACQKDWSSPVISADTADFPLKLTLTDCGSTNSQFSTTLSTPVTIQPVSGSTTFPYTFTTGKVVNSSDEARNYCYANGPGSGQGIAAECESKFGVVYTTITTTPVTNTTTASGRAYYSTAVFETCMTKAGFLADAKQVKTWAQATDPIPWQNLTGPSQNAVSACEREYYGTQTNTTTTTTTQPMTSTQTTTSSTTDCSTKYGSGWHTMGSDGNCFDPNMTNYRTTNGTLYSCSTTPTTGCTSSTTATPPAGQKQQIWNSLGLQSYIRTDADPARIERVKQTCATVPTGANIWLPNAGVSTSVDFGMPSADKCRLAAACTSTQYFDGAACVSNTSSNTACSGTQYWNGTACVSTSQTTTSTYTDCSAKYGSGWHTMGSDGSCFDPEMKNYKTANGTLYSCSTTPTTGCSGSTTTTNTSCPSGQYWYTPPGGGTGYCQSSTTSTGSCTSGQYWNGTACVTSTTSGTCPSGQYWYTPSGGGAGYCQTTSTTNCTSGQYWNGTACVTSTTSSSSCSTPGNCFDSAVCGSSGWYWYSGGCWSSPQQSVSASASSCTSGQYWNGSACVTSTTAGSGTSCPSGQYWTGTACAANPSSSTTCASGQYWNGSACVTSTTTTAPTSTTHTCPSGQYWNGTACVNSTTPSASVYDQMRDQLKSMEIILRGLLGR